MERFDAFISYKLALERPDGFVCEYVGRVPTAKSFGPMPMHLLRRHLSPTGSTMT